MGSKKRGRESTYNYESKLVETLSQPSINRLYGSGSKGLLIYFVSRGKGLGVVWGEWTWVITYQCTYTLFKDDIIGWLNNLQKYNNNIVNRMERLCNWTSYYSKDLFSLLLDLSFSCQLLRLPLGTLPHDSIFRPLIV